MSRDVEIGDSELYNLILQNARKTERYEFDDSDDETVSRSIYKNIKSFIDSYGGIDYVSIKNLKNNSLKLSLNNAVKCKKLEVSSVHVFELDGGMCEITNIHVSTVCIFSVSNVIASDMYISHTNCISMKTWCYVNRLYMRNMSYGYIDITGARPGEISIKNCAVISLKGLNICEMITLRDIQSVYIDDNHHTRILDLVAIHINNLDIKCEIENLYSRDVKNVILGVVNHVDIKHKDGAPSSRMLKITSRVESIVGEVDELIVPKLNDNIRDSIKSRSLVLGNIIVVSDSTYISRSDDDLAEDSYYTFEKSESY